MYPSMNDFFEDWKNESEATMKVLNVLTDESLNQRVTPGGRSLGFLAWHLCTTLGEMGSAMGLPIAAPSHHAPAPSSAHEIASAYQLASLEFTQALARSWQDEMLGEKIPMYGEEWTRGGALVALVRRQIHHRSQMTVLMRQASLPVPGIYGPSREEWIQIGMTPQQ